MSNTNLAMFYNSNEGDRVYDADDMTDWLKPFFLTGVFNGQLQVTANNDMTVTIAPGYVNIGGKTRHFVRSTTIDLETASATLDRIDAVVVRRDDTNRDIYLTVVKGGNSGTPTPPPLVRDGAVYDLRLAEVYVSAGAVRITQAEITDTRMNAAVCGWVASTVTELDFSQITAQFDEFFSQYQAEILTQYNAYLVNIGDKEDAAEAKLQQMKQQTDALYAEYRGYLLQKYSDFTTALDTKETDATSYLAQYKASIDDDYSEFTGYLSTAALNFQTYLDGKEDDADDAYDAMTGTFTSYMTAQQTAFETWFEAIKGQLSTDAAGHLQNEIDNINDALTDQGDDVDRLNEVFQMYVMQNRAIINSLSFNQIAILIELETLTQATIAGTSDNVVIETFDQAVVPVKGYYDSVNKRVYA